MHEIAFECQRHRVGEEYRDIARSDQRREESSLTRSIDRPCRAAKESSSSPPCRSNLRGVKLRIRDSASSFNLDLRDLVARGKMENRRDSLSREEIERSIFFNEIYTLQVKGLNC